MSQTPHQPTRWEDHDNTRGYGERFAELVADGTDIYGEARLADVLAPRNGRILDAGCGMGRIGAKLGTLGHKVSGVDLDAHLLRQSRDTYPELRTMQARLDDLTPELLAEAGWDDEFDVIVLVGNVMILLAPDTEVLVLNRLAALLAPEGRVLVGFHMDATPPNSRVYSADEFAGHVAEAGLTIDSQYSTYELQPFDGSGNYVVSILSHANAAE